MLRQEFQVDALKYYHTQLNRLFNAHSFSKRYYFSSFIILSSRLVSIMLIKLKVIATSVYQKTMSGRNWP
jgi:hypothetical protein